MIEKIEGLKHIGSIISWNKNPKAVWYEAHQIQSNGNTKIFGSVPVAALDESIDISQIKLPADNKDLRLYLDISAISDTLGRGEPTRILIKEKGGTELVKGNGNAIIEKTNNPIQPPPDVEFKENEFTIKTKKEVYEYHFLFVDQNKKNREDNIGVFVFKPDDNKDSTETFHIKSPELSHSWKHGIILDGIKYLARIYAIYKDTSVSEIREIPFTYTKDNTASNHPTNTGQQKNSQGKNPNESKAGNSGVGDNPTKGQAQTEQPLERKNKMTENDSGKKEPEKIEVIEKDVEKDGQNTVNHSWMYLIIAITMMILFVIALICLGYMGVYTPNISITNSTNAWVIQGSKDIHWNTGKTNSSSESVSKVVNITNITIVTTNFVTITNTPKTISEDLVFTPDSTVKIFDCCEDELYSDSEVVKEFIIQPGKKIQYMIPQGWTVFSGIYAENFEYEMLYQIKTPTGLKWIQANRSSDAHTENVVAFGYHSLRDKPIRVRFRLVPINAQVKPGV